LPNRNLSALCDKKIGLPSLKIRPTAILFMTACALLTAVIEQTLPDVFPNRVRATKPDRVRFPNLDHAQTP
jgi:hypothetical protein